jgi:hypothetical protein
LLALRCTLPDCRTRNRTRYVHFSFVRRFALHNQKTREIVGRWFIPDSCLP